MEEIGFFTWAGLAALVVLAAILIRSMVIDYRDVNRMRRRGVDKNDKEWAAISWYYRYHTPGRIIGLIALALLWYYFKNWSQ
jgi:hypothetical protein